MRRQSGWIVVCMLAALQLLPGGATAKPRSSVYAGQSAILLIPPRPTHRPLRICIWTDPHPHVPFPATGLCAVGGNAAPGSACTCYMDFGRETGVVQ